TFSKNSAATGGAIHLSNNSRNIVISESVFTENEATALAAGISVSTSKNSIVITQSKFMLNNCKGGTECRGGAIGIDNNASATIVNSLITKNKAKNYGGGLYVRNDSSANLIFSTLADNTTDGSSSTTGSGIHNYDSAVTNIYSSIVHGNGPANQTQNNTNSATNVTYSLFQGGYSGTGNINADPLFVDRAANDYHLGTGSECIDEAGTAAENPVIDLDGKTRPDGSGFDMGCYEF
ncbi:MAG TPA: choice-of-anchor Q domain-containing protein, partial [bacterium]|nr:choice-of-anchor Q domain-containing protein [bacterium]